MAAVVSAARQTLATHPHPCLLSSFPSLPTPLIPIPPTGTARITRITPPEGTEPVAEIWALQGGPGTPGTALAGPYYESIKAGLPLVAYFPEHRGVGGSARVRCSSGEDASECVVVVLQGFGCGRLQVRW